MTEAKTADQPTKTAVTIRNQIGELLEPIEDRISASLEHTSVSPARLRAVFEMAVAKDPALVTKCDRRTVQTALLQCAQDGLLPDGRRAAILPFKTKVKRNGQDKWILAAQYIPMVQGIIGRARELGEVFSVTPNCVCANDSYYFDETDPSNHRHERAPFGEDRGDIVAAYAIFRDASGNVIHREIMDLAELEHTRGFSKAKDSPAWKNWRSEMYRKTVIRRGSKYVPMSDAMRRIIEREDQHVDPAAIGGPAVPAADYNPLVDEAAPALTSDVELATGEEIEAEESEAPEDEAPADMVPTTNDAEAELLAEFTGKFGEAKTKVARKKVADEYREVFDEVGGPVVNAYKKVLADHGL